MPSHVFRRKQRCLNNGHPVAALRNGPGMPAKQLYSVPIGLSCGCIWLTASDNMPTGPHFKRRYRRRKKISIISTLALLVLRSYGQYFSLDRRNLLCPVRFYPTLIGPTNPTHVTSDLSLVPLRKCQTLGANSDITRVTSYWYFGTPQVRWQSIFK